LTFALHALGSSYTQFGIFAPNLMRQFGDQRRNLVVTPLGRGGTGWYMDEGEADFFEVWADVARRFRLDSERVALTGYSMGGYGTYRLGTKYPDLFGRAFTASAQPARGGWVPPAPPFDPSTGRATADTNTHPLLENARWVPYLDWMQAADVVVPYVAARAQQERFDKIGLRSELWTFAPGEHFTTFFLLDEWRAARDHLGEARVKRDPSRVNYAFLPDDDRPALGLRHDHAYWVSDLRARDLSGDPETDPARAEIDARSMAFGKGDPELQRITSARGDEVPGEVTSVEGTDWRRIPSTKPKNRLKLDLDNVRRATIDGERARLDGDEPLRVRIQSDGDGQMRLDVPLPRGAKVRRIDGPPLSAAGAAAPEVSLDRDGASFDVGEGTREYEIFVSGGSGSGRGFTRERGPDL